MQATSHRDHGPFTVSGKRRGHLVMSRTASTTGRDMDRALDILDEALSEEER